MGDADIAGIGDDVAKRFEVCFETGNADGGGAHVHTAAGLAEIERYADDVDVARLAAPARRCRWAGGREWFLRGSYRRAWS